MKTGRNDPCHCGSGQKYKKCCLTKDNAARSAELADAAAAASAAASAAEQAAGESEGPTTDGKPAAGGRKDAPAARPKSGGGAQPTLFRRRAV